MKVLVYGGSFDPPHRGHARMLAAALDELRPERAYVVPANRSPLKAAAWAAPRHRLRMVHFALAGLPARLKSSVAVEPFELRRGRTSYTVETLNHLRKRHPGAELHFLLGSDALASLADWRRPRELARLARFLVGRRPGAAVAVRGVPGLRLRILPGVFPDLASSDIRLGFLVGEPPAGALARGVLDYIRAQRLYGLAHRDRLARELSPGRMRHTLSVARHAADIALRAGLDAERAALAGLLHDCGRSVPVPRMAAYARRRRLAFPALAETARENPLLIHGHIGADLARRRFGVSDPAVLGAIRKHTLGDAAMAPLDRVLFAADASSPDRTFPAAQEVRRALARGLDEGFEAALRLKLSVVIRLGAWMHPLAAAVWNGMRAMRAR